MPVTTGKIDFKDVVSSYVWSTVTEFFLKQQTKHYIRISLEGIDFKPPEPVKENHWAY